MKIGVTERGDPSIDFSWVEKLPSVDAAIIITKNLSNKVIADAEPFFKKLKFHVTCTGYGGTIVEQNVPKAIAQLKQAKKLTEQMGFPKERVVVRIDPIIPTNKGVQTARDVFVLFAGSGFTEFRVSVIDMYPHVRARFAENKLPLPYENGFAPSDVQLAMVDSMLASVKEVYPNVHIESCAEAGLKNADAVGCVTERDAEQLGLRLDATGSGYQRKGCLCCNAKTELLTEKHRCPYGCLYCYWRDN